MEGGKCIERFRVDLLLEHPANPNQMSGRNFNKLVRHIESTGNYEPVIIRKHPERDGFYEILNGHHRVKALRKLAIDEADCVVWEVSDEEALVLLATLNRLNGRDDVFKKSELINRLSESFNDKQLIAALPDTQKSIERLRELYGSRPALDEIAGCKMLVPLVFLLSTENKRFVENTIAEAIDPGKGANASQKRAWALVKILKDCQTTKI